MKRFKEYLRQLKIRKLEGEIFGLSEELGYIKYRIGEKVLELSHLKENQ